MLEPTTPEALRDAVARCLDEGVRVLAVNGGDGSSHVLLTAWLRATGEGVPLPDVQLLRGGTMNTVASGVGVRGRPERLLAELVAGVREGRPRTAAPRTLLRVSGEEPQYGFLFGNGLISNFLEAYYEGAEPSPAKAAWLLTRAVASACVGGALIRRLMRPVRCEVEAGGETWESRDWLAITAGTVDDIGLRFRPFFEAPAHPGHLHALGLGCGPMGVVVSLPRIRFARPLVAPGIRSAVVPRLRIRGVEAQAFMVDGDFHRGGQSLEVGAGPEVRLLTVDPRYVRPPP